MQTDEEQHVVAYVMFGSEDIKWHHQCHVKVVQTEALLRFQTVWVAFQQLKVALQTQHLDPMSKQLCVFTSPPRPRTKFKHVVGNLKHDICVNLSGLCWACSGEGMEVGAILLNHRISPHISKPSQGHCNLLWDCNV
jgi:hypothetical protein